MTSHVIQDLTLLQPSHIPENFIDRENEKTSLESIFSDVTDRSLRNLHLHGPRGTGKTHLTQHILNQLPSQINTCKISCTRHDTQYKVLKQIYKSVSNEEIENGHHTSELQRRIQERTTHLQAVFFLDEIDFLLLNDGNDLLYYLSRLENSENISIILSSSNHRSLEDQLEERTYSTLQPERIGFEPLTAEQVYQALAERAQASLKSRTLQHEALTYIASTTQNLKLALTWLRIAAKTAQETITEALIHETLSTAYQEYADQLLTDFTPQHRLLYQATRKATNNGEKTVKTGEIYKHYRKIEKESSLSQRRLSDYLKHLELLNLIQSDYHYGGKTGKTREIQWRQPG
jgi:orc1/cdc6 family replication initiation protein